MENKDIERLGTDDPRMSQIVKYGGIVYLSGQVDLTPDTDVTAQTKNICDKIDNLLA